MYGYASSLYGRAPASACGATCRGAQEKRSDKSCGFEYFVIYLCSRKYALHKVVFPECTTVVSIRFYSKKGVWLLNGGGKIETAVSFFVPVSRGGRRVVRRRMAALTAAYPDVLTSRYRPNIRRALAVVTLATTSGSMPFSSAIRRQTCTAYADSLRLPRNGTGAR